VSAVEKNMADIRLIEVAFLLIDEAHWALELSRYGMKYPLAHSRAFPYGQYFGTLSQRF
jgi:hypothetical protein